MAHFDASQNVPNFTDEVAIITGGASGIGAATCALLARVGAKVYSLDIAKPEGRDARIHDVECDVARPTALRSAVAQVVAAEGRIDHLVPCAGVWSGGPLETVTEAEFDRVVAINVKGTFFAIQAVLPTMRAQKSGSIVLIGSDQSLVGKPEQNLYGLTKGAVAQLAKSCAVQYASEGVRVNCVCPGTIATPFVRNAVAQLGDADAVMERLRTAQPVPRLGTAEEIAHAIAFLAKIPYIVGAQLSVDGGYTAQ